MQIFIITAVVSIVVALVWAYMVLMASQSKAKETAKLGAGEYLDSSAYADKALTRAISQEITGLVDSSQQSQEITKAVAGALGKEIEKRVNKTQEELKEKYDKVIDQRSRSEEIALRKYKKVLGEKRNTDAVIRSISDGLVVVDAEGKVIMINPAAERLLDTSKKDKLGKPLLEDLKEDKVVSLSKGSADKQRREIEITSKNDETKKILRSSSAVIENEDGQTVGMVSMLSDITKQKELDRLKSKFVSSVSHELRTPLVAMEKSIALLLSKSPGPVNTNQEQFLSIAHRNLKRLSILIDDLLDLSKLEAGKMRLDLKPSSIEKIIDESVSGLKSWAQAKSIAFDKNIQADLPQVEVDPGRIIQVLNNLIGNAIKFSPKDGHIGVEASLDSDSIKVAVIDSGQGIEDKDLGKVFDKFYQIEDRISPKVSGTGLGLSIAREIVGLHKGKIWAERGKGKGAKFIFSLPLEK